MKTAQFSFMTTDVPRRTEASEAVFNVFEMKPPGYRHVIAAMSLWGGDTLKWVHACLGALNGDGWETGHGVVSETPGARMQAINDETCCWKFLCDSDDPWLNACDLEDAFDLSWQHAVAEDERRSSRPGCNHDLKIGIRAPSRFLDVEWALQNFLLRDHQLERRLIKTYLPMIVLEGQSRRDFLFSTRCGLPMTGPTLSPITGDPGVCLAVRVVLDADAIACSAHVHGEAGNCISPELHRMLDTWTACFFIVIHLPWDTGEAHVVSVVPAGWTLRLSDPNSGAIKESGASWPGHDDFRPPITPWALPSVLTNDSLASLISVRELRHPWLPITILGFSNEDV